MSIHNQPDQSRLSLRWFAPAILLLYGAVLLCNCVEQEWRQEWDSALYLNTARSLAHDQGYSYLGQPFFLRPPALPWLASHLAGGDQFDFLLLNRLVMIMAIVSMFAIYFFMRLNFSRGWALLIAMFTGTSPLFISRFNWILSEFFFLAVFFPAVVLLEWGSREGRRSTAALVGGSLLLAASIYFRTVGILVLPAVLLVILFRRRGAGRFLALLPVLLVLLLVLPWILYSHQAEFAADRPAEQFLLFSYNTALFHLDPGDPDSDLLTWAHWVGRVKRNSVKLVRNLTWAILGTEHWLAATLLLTTVLAGYLAVLIRGPSVIDLFFPAYLLLVLIYFAHQDRLLLPLVPLIYAYLARGLITVFRRTTQRPRLRMAAGVSAGLVILLLAGLNLRGLVIPLAQPRGESGAVSTASVVLPPDHVLVADWLRENTARDAKVVARMAPIVSVLANRDVYTYLYTRKTHLLQRLGINYVVSFGETPDWLDLQVRQWLEQIWTLPGTAAEQKITIYQLKPWDNGQGS